MVSFWPLVALIFVGLVVAEPGIAGDDTNSGIYWMDKCKTVKSACPD